MLCALCFVFIYLALFYLFPTSSVYVGTLLVNFIACLVSLAEGVDNGIGMVFFAIITIVIFTPLSFLFWFRPLYKAFRYVWEKEMHSA